MTADRKAQSDAILKEVQRRLKARVDAISIKGGGGVQSHGGKGAFNLSMNEEDFSPLGGYDVIEPVRREQWEVRGTYPDQVVAINYCGPYADLKSGRSTQFNNPTLDSLPLTWVPQPTIPLGSGVKIYIKFVATDVGADFNDIAAPPATVRKSNSLEISAAGVTIEYGDYSYSPVSTAGTTSTGPPLDTTKTIYKFLVRIDEFGEEDPLDAGEQATEDANNPWTSSFYTPSHSQQWFYHAG